MKMIKYLKIFENIDRFLITLILFLLIIGLITLSSASQQNNSLLVGQLINISLGIIFLVFLSNINPKQFIFYAPHIYIFTMYMYLANIHICI